MTSRVDKRGRVLVPKELRERFGLDPGTPVIVEADEDGVKLRRAIPQREALRRLAGIIPRSAGPPSVDSLEAKRIWETRT
jgi:AbrB family looped-hinge helix DNA binding protein